MSLRCTENDELVFEENADSWHPFSTYGDTSRYTAPLASLHWENSSERIKHVSPPRLFHTQPAGQAAWGLFRWRERRAVISVGLFSTPWSPIFLLFLWPKKTVQYLALPLFCHPRRKTTRRFRFRNLNTRRPTYSLTSAVKITQERRRSNWNSPLSCALRELSMSRSWAPYLKSQKESEQASYLPFLRHLWSTSFLLLCYPDLASQFVHVTGLLIPRVSFQHHGERLHREPRTWSRSQRPRAPPPWLEQHDPPAHTLTDMNPQTPPLTRFPCILVSLTPVGQWSSNTSGNVIQVLLGLRYHSKNTHTNTLSWAPLTLSILIYFRSLSCLFLVFVFY